MTHLSRSLEFMLSQAWAIEPGFHRRMMQVLVRHADGVRLTEAELEAATGKAMPSRPAELRVEGRTAIIPIHGVIAHRAGAVGRVSSRVGTSVEHIRADLQEAIDSPDVDSIVLDIDSPGGSVSGIAELGSEIRAAREKKPIVAHSEGLMASAAYWLGSQATRVVASTSAAVGSIGVISAFYDDHRAAANQGFDPVVIKSTPAKGGMQANGTMSDADRADVQREVDHYHRLFVEAVADGRGITIEKAAELADGRVYIGADAKDRGYVDAIEGFGTAVKAARRMAKEATAARAAAATTAVLDSSSPEAAVDSNQATEAETAMTEQKPNGTAPAPSTGTQTDPHTIRKEAIEAERARCAAIRSAAALPEQEKLVAELIDGGVDQATAIARLAADLKGRFAATKAHLVANSDEALSPGNSRSAVASTPKEATDAMPEGEAKWKAEFAADLELQAEFMGDVGLYIGWQRNQQALKARKPA